MKYLRCMAYRQDGVYVAVCLDLSLAAQADTIQEAMSKLESQITDFVEEAISEPEFTIDLLNKRKAPVSLWVKYFSVWFRMFFSQKNGKLFNEKCNIPS